MTLYLERRLQLAIVRRVFKVMRVSRCILVARAQNVHHLLIFRVTESLRLLLSHLTRLARPLNALHLGRRRLQRALRFLNTLINAFSMILLTRVKTFSLNFDRIRLKMLGRAVLSSFQARINVGIPQSMIWLGGRITSWIERLRLNL